jgi:hypothetical protein
MVMEHTIGMGRMEMVVDRRGSRVAGGLEPHPNPSTPTTGASMKEEE